MSRSITGSALITGASAGLGAELARLFAADGHDVILVARREERLRELADELTSQHGIEAVVIPADLAQPGAAATVVDRVQASGASVGFLVNNAGFGSTGRFAELDVQRELDMVQVNIAALVHFTGLLLPSMIERGAGRVLNISSTAGFQPGPYMATYYASKAFVTHFSEALAYETHGTGVTVTAHCPGATQTEFGSVSGNENNALFTGGHVATAAQVARHAYRAMHRGERVAVHGLRNRVLMGAGRFTPRALVLRVAGKLNRP